MREVGLGNDYIGAIPAMYARDVAWTTPGSILATDRRRLLTPAELAINVNGRGLILPQQRTIDLSAAATWDSTSPDYTVAANRAGKDFYVYAVGVLPIKFLLSANSTVPAGYTALNSRKIGGFHCECVDVGTIANHALSDFVSGDILPASIWDLSHRPVCSPEGMVYDPQLGLWGDIYLQSGTGPLTASVYGGTITDIRTWLDFVDDLAAVGKRLFADPEFQVFARGSNAKTNISGSADPVTTGGHVDTAGRRMISDVGAEDCCGAMWQWLATQSYRYDGGGHNHGDSDSYSSENVDPTPTWSYKVLPGNRGSIYSQGIYGDVKLLGGGSWNDAAACGPGCRAAIHYRWKTASDIGARGCARARTNT